MKRPEAFKGYTLAHSLPSKLWVMLSQYLDGSPPGLQAPARALCDVMGKALIRSLSELEYIFRMGRAGRAIGSSRMDYGDTDNLNRNRYPMLCRYRPWPRRHAPQRSLLRSPRLRPPRLSGGIAAFMKLSMPDNTSSWWPTQR